MNTPEELTGATTKASRTMWYLKTLVAGVLAKLELRDRVQSTGGRSTSSARAPNRRRPS